MSDDLTRTLEPLRSDLARAGIAEPSVVRRRGQRRRITVVVSTALGVALILGAVTVAACLAAPDRAGIPPASTGGPAPTAEPATTRPGR
jgi:hypothetical protein